MHPSETHHNFNIPKVSACPFVIPSSHPSWPHRPVSRQQCFLLCCDSFLFSIALYNWNYSIYIYFPLWLLSLSILSLSHLYCGVCMSIIHFFALLSKIPLYGFTRVYLVTLKDVRVVSSFFCVCVCFLVRTNTVAKDICEQVLCEPWYLFFSGESSANLFL